MVFIHYGETRFGFEYGKASVQRLFADKKTGRVVMSLETPKGKMQIGVSKTGKVTIYASPKTKTAIRFVEVKK